MKRLAFALILLLGVLAGRHTLHIGFISDDFILRNIAESKPLPSIFASNWLGIRGKGGFYRPVAIFFWKLDRAIWGDDPRGYHVSNIIYHVVNSYLLITLLMMLKEDFLTAVLAGAIFAIHPVHAEVIAWLSGGTDAIAAMFYLGALIAFLRWKRDNRSFWMAASLLFSVIAFFSKEIAVTIPLVILLVDYIHEGKARMKTLFRHAFPFIAAIFFAIAIRSLALGELVGGYGADKHLAFNLHVFNYIRMYFNWLFTPLSVLVARPPLVGLAMTILAGILLAFIAVMYREFRGAILFFWLTLLPVLTICRAQYLYIPSMGFCWGLAIVFSQAIQGKHAPVFRTGTKIFLCVLLAYYGFMTIRKNTDWAKTGWTVRGVRNILLTTHPNVQRNARIILDSYPRFESVSIGMFQNGFREAVRFWYHVPSLDGRTTFNLAHIPELREGVDILLTHKSQRWFDLSGCFPRCLMMTFSGLNRRFTSTSGSFHLKDFTGKFSGVAIWSQLANAAWIPENTVIAELEARFANGGSVRYPIRAGRDTAEWSIDAPAVSRIARHGRAPIGFSYIEGSLDSEPVPGHTYLSVFSWGTNDTISEVIIHPKVPGPGPHGEKPIFEIRGFRGITQEDV